MDPMKRKPRVAIVSPFLDQRHGTERIVIEWLSRLADSYELHVYSQRVADFDPKKFTLHRIAELPGPHILNYLWWFFANRALRAWHAWFGGLKHDLVYTPGVNCFDADVISVHIVFAEFFRQARPELRFEKNPARMWPRLLHRRIYYRLIITLEKLTYSCPSTQLVLIAKKTSADLQRFYGRGAECPILYLGLDHGRFNPERCSGLRDGARSALGLAPSDFTVLLVGNDLLKKGILTLFDAVSRLHDLPLKLIVVSRESGSGYQAILAEEGLLDRVQFCGPRNDVEFYFAAADLYAGPSLEDTFAMPPEEAMACSLPIVASLANGIAEIITHRENGLILDDARDAESLARMIRQVVENPQLRASLGRNAHESVQKFTWEANARDLKVIFEDVLRRKGYSSSTGNALEPNP